MYFFVPATHFFACRYSSFDLIMEFHENQYIDLKFSTFDFCDAMHNVKLRELVFNKSQDLGSGDQ